MLAPVHRRPYIPGMARPRESESLDPRARQLLRTLIGRYIRDGEPVGSQTLARHAGLDVSPATIRNILADLEGAGLLAAPHASAGRVPTAQGYRVFVDSLLQLKPLGEGELSRLRQELPPGSGTQALLGSASELLSAMTHFVGVVTVPQHQEVPFRHIDFVPLDQRRTLVILVFTDGQVQNRVIELERAYPPAELEQVANYLNAQFSGQRLDEIRLRLLREMQETSNQMNRLMAATVELAQQAFNSAPPQPDMFVAGQTNLMGLHEASSLERLRELFEAFQRKRDLLQLLERCAQAEGVRLFIGEESGFSPLGGYSLVTAPYAVDGRVLGVLGVIGPTRMAYERVIPVVQATARVLSSVMSERGA